MAPPMNICRPVAIMADGGWGSRGVRMDPRAHKGGAQARVNRGVASTAPEGRQSNHTPAKPSAMPAITMAGGRRPPGASQSKSAIHIGMVDITTAAWPDGT